MRNEELGGGWGDGWGEEGRGRADVEAWEVGAVDVEEGGGVVEGGHGCEGGKDEEVRVCLDIAAAGGQLREFRDRVGWVVIEWRYSCAGWRRGRGQLC